MRRRGFVLALLPSVAAVCAMAWFALSNPSAVTSTAAYWSAIHATVLAVDRRHKTVTIRHEALETAPAGVRVCAVRDARSLKRLRAGALIEARAETSHAQWLLDGIHVVGRSGASDGISSHMALVTAPRRAPN